MVVRGIALAAVVATAAALRLLPHPPNFTPVAAIALFGGAYFADRRLAFAVPLAAMALSDLVLGIHLLLPVVYGAFALTVLIGFWLRTRRAPGPIVGAALASSVLFFVLTNFAVWATGPWYPKSPAGLVAAYVAALPFFRNTLAGDLFYTVILFGGFALLERLVPALREPKSAAG